MWLLLRNRVNYWKSAVGDCEQYLEVSQKEGDASHDVKELGSRLGRLAG
jgi:hypothetical protein